MNVKQLYTNCLAQGAYYISHNGEAAIIDPLRETRPYTDLLKQNNDTLKYIFETHFHADFVSGHVDLAKATGAKIVFGPDAKTNYDSYIAKDNEEFKIGGLTLRVLHTPGHTLESSTYLLLDENGKPHCIFSGDTLFIGDVGRPDLAIKSDLTQEDLAGMLYDSLRKKIMTLPDDVIVYPAHGAGSACGKNMSKETFDTLGNQKKVNYALQNLSKQDFVKELTTGIAPAPQYFAKNALLNKDGYKNFSDVMQAGANALDIATFEEVRANMKPIVLDVRKPEEFAAGHIPGSLYIGLDGQFAPWVGTVIHDITFPLLIVAPVGREEETVMRLSRVGYDNSIGYLKGGFDAWKTSGKEIATIENVTADQYVDLYKKGISTLDVRKPGEYDANHLSEAINKPLDYIFDWMGEVDQNKKYYVNCAGGYRSVIAASILKANGYHNLVNVLGGFGAIAKTGVETCATACSKS
ncbi:MAG: Zn-dependent hydrolase, glyoxylase [Bacteroidetes bacterium]|jgi:glyoxylase-like metal-dependent hydrolase (beta-lactamase superfamily II)/rhodanese-related sulfurtransferase|nr:Zn-dependent hydrolase, glyoxylase [Bacteroidota bacterium]